MSLDPSAPLPPTVHPATPSTPPARSAESRRTTVLLAILAALLVALLIPYVTERVQYALAKGTLRARADVAAEELARLEERAELVGLADTSRAFRLVAQRVEPSVVHINTVQVNVDSRGPADEWTFRSPGRRYLARGQGSGVIVDPAGYIVTNFHVIERANAISVQLADGRTIREVQVVGYDVLTDLAVLKISAPGLVAAEWGDSDALEVGDWVLAIGNPYGLDRTVTMGIVSAKDRRGVARGSPYQDFLQTDTAVNPGNSGGPLVNIAGKIVGINTAIVGEAFQGISFAIPSRRAREVFDKLVASGKVVRGWLGVAVEELTPELASQLGVRAERGVVVRGVVRGSPAEAAGLEPGDVVVAWDDEPISDPTEFTLRAAQAEIGTKVRLRVLRGRAEVTVAVTIRERPDTSPAPGR